MEIVDKRGIGVKPLEGVPSILIMIQTRHHVTPMAHPLGKKTSRVEVVDVRLEKRRESSTGKWGAFHCVMHTVLMHVILTLQCHSLLAQLVTV